MTNTADISKDLEERRAARRAAARQAAAPEVAAIQAEQARVEALSPAARKREQVERYLATSRFKGISDIIAGTPRQEGGRWVYPVEFQTRGSIDWMVGTLQFFTGGRAEIRQNANPNFPWCPQYSDER